MKLQSNVGHIFLLIVTALMLNGCSGGGGEENTSDSPGPVAVSPPPVDPPPSNPPPVDPPPADPPPMDPPPGTGNSAPSISGVPGNSVMVGEAYFFRPTASDPDDDFLVFSIQNLPVWASFDAISGRLSGVPDAGDEGEYANISITVTDGTFLTTLSAFTVSVNQISLGSATLTWTAPTQNEDGSPLTDLTAYKFYYGTSQGSYGNPILVNNPGITSYVIENLAPNTYYFAVTVMSSSGIESSFSNEAVKIVF